MMKVRMGGKASRVTLEGIHERLQAYQRSGVWIMGLKMSIEGGIQMGKSKSRKRRQTKKKNRRKVKTTFRGFNLLNEWGVRRAFVSFLDSIYRGTMKAESLANLIHRFC